jgi:thioredoxin 2
LVVSSTVTACPGCGKKSRVPSAAHGRPQCAACGRALPWVAEATDADINEVLDTKQLVVVDLWAPWCRPCRLVTPVLERLASRYAGRVKVVKVNVDDNPAAAAHYEARSIPTLVMIRAGVAVDRLVGAHPEPVITQHVEAALEVG